MNKLSMVLPVETVKQVLSSCGGKFITITAIKKNGDETVINGKMVDSPPSHDNHNNLVSLAKNGNGGGYRTADLRRVTRIVFAGNVLAKAG